MPYADPARSAYCAARHLLRHAGNALELRRNPLVCASVDRELSDPRLVSVVQAKIDRAFAAMDQNPAAFSVRRRSRHAAILLRCDVFREPRRTVARALTLSLPQFERERRAAMTRFLESFQRSGTGGEAMVDSVRTGLARTVRDRAVRLADSGHRQSALTLLDDVVRNAGPMQKVQSLIRVAEIEAGDHAVHRAKAALRSAATVLQGDSLTSEESGRLWLAHEAAALRVCAVEHGPQAAAQSILERRSLPPSAESIALLVSQAEVLDACGMAKACRPFVSQALELVPAVPEIEPATGVDLAVLKSQLNFWLDPSANGRAGLDEAISIARGAGYAGRAVFMELSALGGRWAATNAPETRRKYRALLEHIRRYGEMPRETRFVAYWDAADVECGLGDPWRAAEAARNALALAPNPQRALLMKALLARAYARGRRLAMSERIALEVIEDRDAGRSGMAVFSAKRTLAYLASLGHRPREAWQHLSDARELAPRYGTARAAADLEQTLTKFRRQTAPSVSIVFRSPEPSV